MSIRSKARLLWRTEALREFFQEAPEMTNEPSSRLRINDDGTIWIGRARMGESQPWAESKHWVPHRGQLKPKGTYQKPVITAHPVYHNAPPPGKDHYWKVNNIDVGIRASLNPDLRIAFSELTKIKKREGTRR
jgi:hypothetical protein